jgi:hypothetical protein
MTAATSLFSIRSLRTDASPLGPFGRVLIEPETAQVDSGVWFDGKVMFFMYQNLSKDLSGKQQRDKIAQVWTTAGVANEIKGVSMFYVDSEAPEIRGRAEFKVRKQFTYEQDKARFNLGDGSKFVVVYEEPVLEPAHAPEGVSAPGGRFVCL